MALTAINFRLCSEALEWTRIAADKEESELERWQLLQDVDDFDQRLRSQDCKKISDDIQQYVAEAVGYEYDKGEEEEEIEEVIYQSPTGEILQPPPVLQPQDGVHDPNDVHEEEEEDLDISEVASEDFVEGELNVAQSSSEFEQELEAQDEYEYMKQLHEEQMKNMEDAHVKDADDEPLEEALKQAEKDLKSNGASAQPKCGDNQPTVIKERTVEFSELGGTAGKTLKIRYQGKEIDEKELDDIQELAEEMVEDKTNTEEYMNQNFRYYSLCRGEEVIKRDLSILKCRYRVMNLPYNVWREEFLSRDPAVSMIYNFVTHSEMDELKTLSEYHLNRAMAGSTYIEERVQSSSWHHENTSASIWNLSNRVNYITGLDAIESAETWQVGQYGLGGYYAAHFDYNAKRFTRDIVRDKVMGDRIATFMLYLSDVQAGGYTVFPEIGIFARPIQGSAVFWYNYSLDGEADPRTLHAGCPVLMGHKTVANKWIHMYGNEFNRPCGCAKAVRDCDVNNC